MTFVDLEPAARRMSALVSGAGHDLLGAPTPCRDYTLGALLDHIDRFTLGSRRRRRRRPTWRRRRTR
jgi:hypothetical protein